MTDTHVHNLSGYLPYLRLGNDLLVPTYFIVISLSLCIALVWLVRRAERFELDRNAVLDIALAVMLGGFLGARVLHVLHEAPSYYRKAPLRILEIWYGGFVWYGGALGGFLAGWIVLRRKKLPLGATLDLIAPVAALGYGLGRLSCVLSGCCFGAVCELAPTSLLGASFRYPTQLFAVIWELGLVALLLLLERRRPRHLASRSLWLHASGQLFTAWLIGHSVGRIIMEAFRADDRGPTIVGPISLSTAISFILIGAALVRTLWLVRTPSV